MDAMEILSSLVLQDGRTWAEAAYPFQWEDAESILQGDVLNHYLTRARGAAKTQDLAGITIAAMLGQAPAGAKLYGLAADRKQVQLLMDSISDFQAATPFLRDAFTITNWVVRTPARVEFEAMPANEEGTWGKRPWFVIIDELAQWGTTDRIKRRYKAMMTSTGKHMARMVVITSAGDPVHWSNLEVLEKAKEQPKHWLVHEVPGPPPWLPKEFLERMKFELFEDEYQRLFENRWTASTDRLTNLDDLDACMNQVDHPLPPERGRKYVIGLDLAYSTDNTVAAICHLERETPFVEPSEDDEPGKPKSIRYRVVLDEMEVWTPTKEAQTDLDDVETWLLHRAPLYNNALVHFDVYQALHMMQRLKSRGVRVEEYVFNQAQVARLARTLYMLLRNRALWLPADDALRDELANVRLRQTSPGVYRVDHDPNRHDDRATALGLAAIKLVQGRPEPAKVGTGKSIYS